MQAYENIIIITSFPMIESVPRASSALVWLIDKHPNKAYSELIKHL